MTWRRRFHLARLYLQQKQNEKARDTLESIYRVKPDLPGLTAALGDVNARSEEAARGGEVLSPGGERAARRRGSPSRSRADPVERSRNIRRPKRSFAPPCNWTRTTATPPSGWLPAWTFKSDIRRPSRFLNSWRAPRTRRPTCFSSWPPVTITSRARKEALANYERFLQLSNGKNPDQEWQATQRAKLLRRELSK